MKSAIETMVRSHMDFTLENDCSKIQFSYDNGKRSWDIVTVVNDDITIRQYAYRTPSVDEDYLTIYGPSENLNIRIKLTNYKFTQGAE